MAAGRPDIQRRKLQYFIQRAFAAVYPLSAKCRRTFTMAAVIANCAAGYILLCFPLDYPCAGAQTFGRSLPGIHAGIRFNNFDCNIIMVKTLIY